MKIVKQAAAVGIVAVSILGGGAAAHAGTDGGGGIDTISVGNDDGEYRAGGGGIDTIDGGGSD
jgi:hypothetical protein